MKLEEYLTANNVPFNKDVSLYKVTKRNNGGACAFYCKPKASSALKGLVGFLNKEDINYHLIGDSSNCYFLEKGEPLVIVTTKGFNDVLYEDEDVLVCSSGFNLNKLAKLCVARNVAGYEGFLGVPGTVGGAVVNNSGAFESEMSKVVRAVTVVDAMGFESKVSARDLGFELRSSLFKKGGCNATILSVEFDCSKKTDGKALAEKVDHVVSFRKKHIDNNKVSLGSICVSSSYKYLRRKYYVKLLIKSIVYYVCKHFVKENSKALNTALEMFTLGLARYTRNCDTINRFYWTKETEEKQFIGYLNDLYRISDGTLKLEVEIKGGRALVEETVRFTRRSGKSGQ